MARFKQLIACNIIRETIRGSHYSETPPHANWYLKKKIQSGTSTLTLWLFKHSQNSSLWNAHIISKTLVVEISQTVCVGSEVTYSNVFFLAKVTHANVIPEMRRLRHCCSCYSIFGKCHIEIIVLLHHRPHSQDCIALTRVKGQCTSQGLKGSMGFAKLEIEETKGGKKVRVLRVPSKQSRKVL